LIAEPAGAGFQTQVLTYVGVTCDPATTGTPTALAISA
jgi:hypothetical protein